MTFRLKSVAVPVFALAWLSCIPAAALPAPAPTPAAVSLSSCVKAALAADEELKRAEQRIRQSRSRYETARSGALPDVSFVGSEFIQDTSGLRSSGNGNNNSNSLRRRRTEAKFTATQPLFKGFKEFHAMGGYRREMERDEASLRHERVELMESVAAGFYEVLIAEANMQDVDAVLALTRERVVELRERVRLGKSRDSEVVGAESRLASHEARRRRHQGELEAGWEHLSFLTGLDLRGRALVDDVIRDGEPVPDLMQALERAKRRSDISAARADLAARRAGIRVANAGFSPYVYAVGNYYTKRTGFQEPIDWDAQFNLEMPLFQGGSIRADRKLALSLYEEARFALSRLEREVEAEVRTRHARLRASTDEARLLEQAYLRAKRSYEFQVREYRLGLVNNLDVLESTDTMLSAKQDFDTARLQARLDRLALRAAIEDVE